MDSLRSSRREAYPLSANSKEYPSTWRVDATAGAHAGMCFNRTDLVLQFGQRGALLTFVAQFVASNMVPRNLKFEAQIKPDR